MNISIQLLRLQKMAYVKIFTRYAKKLVFYVNSTGTLFIGKTKSVYLWEPRNQLVTDNYFLQSSLIQCHLNCLNLMLEVSTLSGVYQLCRYSLFIKQLDSLHDFFFLRFKKTCSFKSPQIQIICLKFITLAYK